MIDHDGIVHVCPECVAGKHRNCRGDALCLIEDALTSCDCASAGHPATVEGTREGTR